MITFSKDRQLRSKEYGIYFNHADFNCFELPWLQRIKADTNIISLYDRLIILKRSTAVSLFEDVRIIVSFCRENEMSFLAIPVPFLYLGEIKQFRIQLSEITDGMNIRLILPEAFAKITSLGTSQYERILSSNEMNHSHFRYSLNDDPAYLAKLEERRKSREQRYRMSLDYSNYEKQSIETLKQQLSMQKNQLEKPFSLLLFDMIREKQLDEVELYKKANLDRKHFSKMRNDPNYHPSKATAISLCIAMHLTIEETEMLLNTLGISLSMSDLSDVIVKSFILNEIYDIDELNLFLLENNLKPVSYY